MSPGLLRPDLCPACRIGTYVEINGMLECNNCGNLDSHPVATNEVAFAESSKGGASVQGITVGHHQRTARFTGIAGRHGGHSSEETTANHYKLGMSILPT
jgi:hypothetical protein